MALLCLPQALQGLTFVCLLAFFSFGFCADAGKGERCSDGRTLRMCGLTPSGVWQGKPTYDPYEALGVPPNAPLVSIQQAYRVKARACHPDKLRLSCPLKHAKEDETQQQKEQDEDPFIIINAAYEMLRKPQDRSLFDKNGLGDGGRFVRRGSFAAAKKNYKKKTTSIVEIMNMFAERMNFNSNATEDDDDESEDEDEEDEGEESFSFNLNFNENNYNDNGFMSEEEEDTEFAGSGIFGEEEGDEEYFDFDVSDLVDIF